jgi:penicillin-binding protein 2
MYHKQIKIFVILTVLLLAAYLLRLVQMQLLSNSFYRDKIAQLELQKGRTQQFKTMRGQILDRKGKVLAVDEPRFQLCIKYELTCFMDERIRRSILLKAAGKNDGGVSAQQVQEKIDESLPKLNTIINISARLGEVKPAEIKARIQKINDFIWKRRTFQAWRENFPNSEVFKSYKDITTIPGDVATADFEQKQPSQTERLGLINKTDIIEMHKPLLLLELKTDDDIFTAQQEFSDFDGIEITAKPQRIYPFGPAAAQTIGWVGPVTQEADRQLFADDKLLSYLDDDVCGREDGIEYACEPILRGRRGESVYDIDSQLIDETQALFGADVSLTLDIKLQERIEKYIADCEHNPNCMAPTAAVVIEVNNGDILSLVSLPNYDLNSVRENYGQLVKDANEPLRNRAINKQYPSGSAVKPLILTAGLEAGKITAEEIIPCPAEKAPRGWPSCWIYNKYQWTGHSDMWPNNARNAIKGSCNIYFSRLADRIEPRVLQRWLYKFGYGHVSPLVQSGEEGRDLRQAAGQISDAPVRGTISFFGTPPLTRGERRFFGIGQGNLRATPLQAANAMAAIARGFIYKPPRLLLTPDAARDEKVLGVSMQTLSVVRDGMSAVVNEPQGTAYNEFATSNFTGQGVKVYGKTGSTEAPENAWFCGFAEDVTGKKIAIAVLVEGGKHGASDAGPLARNIIQFCIEAGYIGAVSH